MWSGELAAAPKSQQLLKIVEDSPKDEVDTLLGYLSSQIVLSAPLKAIPVLLSVLSCSFHKDSNTGQIDVSYLGKSGAQTKAICGMMFKKGDLVWTCQTCGKDPTCVQCDACFRDSDHTGHEVYFHRSIGSGGCCDCGDAEAWASTGNCSLHGSKCARKHSEGGIDDYDPLSTVPQTVIKGLRAVLTGVVGLLVSYSTAISRGFQPYDQNVFVQWSNTYQDIKLVGKLHNDDIHTFEDVTSGLIATGVENVLARKLTEEVDAKGESVLPLEPSKLRSAWSHLADRKGLMVSLLPEQIAFCDNRIVTALAWLHQTGTINDGLQRLVGLALTMNVSDLLPISSCMPAVKQRSPSSAREGVTLLAPNMIFDSPEEFPSKLQHLPTLHPSITAQNNAASSSASSSSAAGASLTSSLAPSSSLMEGIGSTAAGGAGVSSPSSEPFVNDELKAFPQPFVTCPRVALAIAMAASPLYSKALKKTLNGLIIVFQKDWMFKSKFSQLLTVLYMALYGLFISYVGSEEGSVLETSVQVYTANSIVRMLSSDGVGSRLLQENGPPVHISRVIVDCLRTCLAACGATLSNISTGFLTNSAIEKNRLSHLFRDVNYIFENPVAAVHVLRGERDPGTVRFLKYSIVFHLIIIVD